MTQRKIPLLHSTDGNARELVLVIVANKHKLGRLSCLKKRVVIT